MPEIDARFHHHPYLAAVAQEDVRYLLEKDRSYGASWKLAGGRSAWFMLRRKMDRMIEMLKRPASPAGFDPAFITGRIAVQAPQIAHIEHLVAAYRAEDIFGMIEADPSGRDGCVLAEVRDLRRYLLLVEAEMVSRGVVADPTPEQPEPAPGYGSGVNFIPRKREGNGQGDEWSSQPNDDVVSRAGIG